MSGRWDLLLEEDSTGEHPRITKGAIWWDGLVPVIVQDGTHSHSLGQAVVRRVGARIEVSLTPAARCLLDVGEGWEIGGTVDDRYTLDNWHPSGSGVAPVFARAQLRLVTVYRRPESANKSTGEATEMDRDATCCRANGRREVETLDGKPISCSEAVEMLGGIDVMLNSRPWVGGWRPEFDYEIPDGHRSVKQRDRDGLVLTEEWDDKAETCGHWVRPGPYVRRAEPPTAAEARAAGVEL